MTEKPIIKQIYSMNKLCNVCGKVSIKNICYICHSMNCFNCNKILHKDNSVIVYDFKDDGTIKKRLCIECSDKKLKNNQDLIDKIKLLKNRK